MRYQEFKGFQLRNDQRTVVEGVLDAASRGKKATIVVAPTGSGKSIIAKTIATAFQSAYLLTPTKILQDQYNQDFEFDIRQKMLKGKSSYFCAMMEEEEDEQIPVLDVWCQSGTSSGRAQIKKCKEANRCHYYNAVEEARNSEIALMNFTGYLVWMMVSERMPEPYFIKRDLHVVDEAHAIENTVREFLGFQMRWDRLKKMFYWVDGPLFKNTPRDDEEEVLGWLKDLHSINTKHLNDLQIRAGALNRDELLVMCEESEGTNKEVRQHYGIEQKLNRLFTVVEGVNSNAYGVGVVRGSDPSDINIVAKPLHVGGYVKRQVHGLEHSLFLSATLPGAKTWAAEIGLSPGEFEVFNMESTFPAKNRQVYCMPVGRINQRTKNELLKPVCDRIHEILSEHPKEKGIIHTPSYEWSDKIKEELSLDVKIGARLLVATRKEFRTKEVLEAHARNPAHTVIVSPAMREGVDLKGDLSRVQIIIKAPFDSLGDPCVRKKAELNKKWYQMNALMSFMQQVGRSIRGPEDWAHTYVLDEALVKLIEQYWKELPKYFTDAIVLRCES